MSIEEFDKEAEAYEKFKLEWRKDRLLLSDTNDLIECAEVENSFNFIQHLKSAGYVGRKPLLRHSREADPKLPTVKWPISAVVAEKLFLLSYLNKAIQVRQLLPRNRRASKLAGSWRTRTFIVFVGRGLLGPILILDNDLDISKTPSVLRFEVYVIPVRHSLAECSNSHVVIGLLRWFLSCRVEIRIFRTTLVWLANFRSSS